MGNKKLPKPGAGHNPKDHANPTQSCEHHAAMSHAIQIEPSLKHKEKEIDEKKYWIDQLSYMARQLFAAHLLNGITAVAAGAAILYAGITYGQWSDANKNFRIDQRPWVAVLPANKPEELITWPQGEVRGDILISNTGKTIARQVKATFRLDLRMYRDGDERELLLDVPGDPYHPPAHYELGDIFPNSPPRPLHIPILTRMSTTEQPQVDHLTDKAENLDNEMYMRVFGIVTYVDAFGKDHWTKYCQVFRGSKIPTAEYKYWSSPSKKCVEYNDADRNE